MIRLTKEAICYIQATDLKLHYYEMTPQEARVMRAVPTWQSSNMPHLASIEDLKIPMRDGQEINIRLYIPEHAKNLPVIIYYHGGGWVFGDLESADAGCQLLAAKAHAIVVSVDYRLAPEYPFPIPLNDAYDGLLWIFDNIAAFGGDNTRLTVAGDSAGGNLATVVSYLAAMFDGPTITAQVLIYPVINLDFTTASYSAYGEHFGLDTLGMQWFAEHYIEPNHFHNPLVSPLHIENPSVLPKTMIIAAEADVLYDEGLAYAQKLSAAGVYVEHVQMAGLIHSYFSKMEFFEAATIETVEKIASFVK